MMRSAKVYLPSALALALSLGVTLPAGNAEEPAPVPPAVAAPAPECPAAGVAAAPPEAPAPAAPFDGLMPPVPTALACPPLAAGCCIVYRPPWPCPMCDGFECEDP